MPAQFRELLPNSGFDDQTPTGGAGIVIPYRSANVVLKDSSYHQAMLHAQHGGSTPDKVVDMVSLKTGDLRVVKITANSLVGLGKAKIEAGHDHPREETLSRGRHQRRLAHRGRGDAVRLGAGGAAGAGHDRGPRGRALLRAVHVLPQDLVEALALLLRLAPQGLVHVSGHATHRVLDRRRRRATRSAPPLRRPEPTGSPCLLWHAGTISIGCLHRKPPAAIARSIRTARAGVSFASARSPHDRAGGMAPEWTPA